MSISIHEATPADTNLSALVVSVPKVIGLSDDDFFELCQANRELRIERSAAGELIFMAPAGLESGHNELEIALQLGNWSKRDGTGIAFGPSAGFRLPNGATRAPDASWMRLPKWNALSGAERKKFARVCPDFVVELRSPSDDLKELRGKMEEFIANGVELGLLVDPEEKQAYLYRPNVEPMVVNCPKTIACDPTLPGFVLQLEEIWR